MPSTRGPGDLWDAHPSFLLSAAFMDCPGDANTLACGCRYQARLPVLSACSLPATRLLIITGRLKRTKAVGGGAGASPAFGPKVRPLRRERTDVTLHISSSETIYDETDSVISCQQIYILHLKNASLGQFDFCKDCLFGQSLSVGVMISYNLIPRKTMKSVNTTDFSPAMSQARIKHLLYGRY